MMFQESPLPACLPQTIQVCCIQHHGWPGRESWLACPLLDPILPDQDNYTSSILDTKHYIRTSDPLSPCISDHSVDYVPHNGDVAILGIQLPTIVVYWTGILCNVNLSRTGGATSC